MFYRLQGNENLSRGGPVLRCVRWVLLAFVVMPGWGALARGQERLLPVRMGRAYFLPSVMLSYGWDDNVQRLSEDALPIGPIASGIGDIQPILRFVFPYRRSLLRLVYRGDFRTYSAEILKGSGGMSHFVDFGGHFVVARRMQLDVAARYIDSITALLNTLPGGEYQYGTQPLTAKEASLGMSIELGSTQSVEMGAARSETYYQPSATSELFSDYSIQSLYFRYVLDSGPQNQVYLSTDRQDVQQGGVKTLLQPDEYRIQSVGAGFRRTTSPDLASEIHVAYSSTDFVGGLGTPFRGVTLEGDVNLAPSPRTQFQLKLRRAPLVSFFNVSSYYLNELIEFNCSRALGRMLALRLFLGTQRNTYSDPIQAMNIYANLEPSEGDLRQDRLATASLNLLWHVDRAMDLNLGYVHQQARSNVVALESNSHSHIYDYESHGLVLSATLGWQ
jgi:putative beta-barrel porin BBP2